MGKQRAPSLSKSFQHSRVIRYRLLPTPEQEKELRSWRWHLKTVTNEYIKALQDRMLAAGCDFTPEGFAARAEERERAHAEIDSSKIDNEENLSESEIEEIKEKLKREWSAEAKGKFHHAAWKAWLGNGEKDDPKAVKNLVHADFRKIREKYKKKTGINASSVEEIMSRLDKTFLKSINHTKYPRAGFPKFRKFSDRCNFSLRLFDGTKRVNTVIGKDTIKFPKIGRIRYVKHKQISNKLKGALCFIQYDKRNGGFYEFGIMYEHKVNNPWCGDECVGLDLGVSINAMLSNGERHQWVSKKQFDNMERIKVLQRKRSRLQGSKKGEKRSNMYHKLTKKISRLHYSIAEDRKRLQYEAANAIIKGKKMIVIENLQLGNMTRSAKGTKEKPGKNVKAKSGLNRALTGAALRQFVGILEFKAEEAEVQIIKVPPAYTSLECSECGHVDKNSRRNQAEFECTECGYAYNADYNAAKNILSKGVKLLEEESAGVSACS